MKAEPEKLKSLTVEDRRQRYVEKILAAGGRLPREHYEKQAERMYPDRKDDDAKQRTSSGEI